MNICSCKAFLSIRHQNVTPIWNYNKLFRVGNWVCWPFFLFLTYYGSFYSRGWCSCISSTRNGCSRSEERRVGKEGRDRGSAVDAKGTQGRGGRMDARLVKQGKRVRIQG